MNEPETFSPITPAAFYILLALAKGERHGYAIMQDVAASTAGKLRLGPGTLYGTIKRLLADGLIIETGEHPKTALAGERRRYYRLSDLGRRVASAEAERLERLVGLARERRLLGGSGGA